MLGWTLEDAIHEVPPFEAVDRHLGQELNSGLPFAAAPLPESLDGAAGLREGGRGNRQATGPSPHASTQKEHESATGLWGQRLAERSQA